MRGIVTVLKEDEYKLWLAKQQPIYAQIMKDKAPAPAPAAGADSTKTAKN